MTLEPDDLDDIVRDALAEPEPAVTEAEIQAALADPTLAGIIARAIQPRERLLTPKGLEHARRTLATVFLVDPGAASLLARAREADASGILPDRSAKPRRRRGRMP